MTRANLYRTVRQVLRSGRIPTKRRRERWQANWAFEQVVSTLGPGDIAIDCGANVGKYTSILVDTGARVFAFEPDPYAFERLSEAVGDAENVVLLDRAVGTENGTVQLFRNKGFDADPYIGSRSSSVFVSKSNMDAATAITVEQVDICAFIDGLGQPVALLKLDVEGSEVPILQRLLESGLSARIGHIFAETHDKRIPELARGTARLRQFIHDEGISNINLDWH